MNRVLQTCLQCGSEFVGRKRKYCDSTCKDARDREWTRRKLAQQKAKRTQRTCGACGTDLPADCRSDKRFCDKACFKKVHRIAYRDRAAVKKAQWVERNRDHVRKYAQRYHEENRERISKSRSLFYMENSERLREECARFRRNNPEWFKNHYQSNREYYAAAGHRRRVKMRNGQLGSPWTWTQVMDRDGWACYLCRERIDPEADRTRDPWSGNVDHVVPIARGGGDGLEFVAATHRYCNRMKGKKLLEELTLPFPAPPVKSVAPQRGEMVAS